MIKIKLYGDLKRRAGVGEIEMDAKGRRLSKIIEEIAGRYGIADLIYRKGRIRGELLILVNGADWNSLGYLDKEVSDGSIIKLVPVWHGG